MARKNGNGGNGERGVTTALIYSRVSSEDQRREGLSLPAQLQACRQYAADRGWVLGAEYQDVLSGTRDDRPQYQELLTEARRLASEGGTVAVVVMRLDRFGRRLMERIRSREEFKKLGVATHSVKEGEVSDLMAGMLAVIAQEEVERLGDRVRDVRTHVEGQGWKAPGRPAWGYRFRPSTSDERAQGAPKSVLVPDDATAPYVREAFAKVASGEMTPRALASWVARLPPAALGEVIGERGARQMHPRAVRLVLRAPVYVARFDDGGTGRWEPLIDVATWDAVQARLAARARMPGPHGGQFLLTGFLRCPKCGSRMGGWTKGDQRRYRCSSFVQPDGGRAVRECSTSLTAAPLDQQVIERVTRVLAPLAGSDANLTRALARLWERMRRPNDQAARQHQRTVVAAQKSVEDARRRIANATRLLVDGTIDKGAYDALAEEEQRRLALAEETLASAQAPNTTLAALPSLDVVLAALGGWQEVLATGETPAQRDLLTALIVKVEPVRLAHGRWRADIAWTAPLGQTLDDATPA